MSGVVISELAPAKLNLFLHVTGQRSDGYHEIESLFVFADFGDEVLIREGPGIELIIEGPFAKTLGDVEDNLVMKAARLIAQAAGANGAGANIILVKRLPVASGLGGGSADAAATLLALNKYWALGLSKADLAKMAQKLGADVPACIYGRASFVTGIGENITPLGPFPRLAVTIVNPGIPLSTPAVFKRLKDSGAAFGTATGMPEILQREGPVDMANWLLSMSRNDLQSPAVEMVPEIGEVLGLLEESPECRLARMSGSGASCFGLFDDMESARQAARLASQQPGWWSEAISVS